MRDLYWRFRYWYGQTIWRLHIRFRFALNAPALDEQMAVQEYVLKGYRTGVKDKEDWQDYLVLGAYLRNLPVSLLHQQPEFDRVLAEKRLAAVEE